MTEAEWLECGDPEAMLDYVGTSGGSRKSRLFSFAACRTVWHLLASSAFQEVIRISELHIDGFATDAELGEAISAAHRARTKGDTLGKAVYDAARFRAHSPYYGHRGLVRTVARELANEVVPDPPPVAISRFVDGRYVTEEFPETPIRKAWNVEFAKHVKNASDLLRDIFGNPFRSIALDSNLQTSTAVALAAQMYESQDFSVMPILADALQDAGCENADILDHCRGPGPHVRGCWVVDRVLGKK